jgi:ABC-type glycerol-3-phosphate transport system permease component
LTQLLAALNLVNTRPSLTLACVILNTPMAALITSIPPLIIFVFLGRYFVAGLMVGTLKG